MFYINKFYYSIMSDKLEIANKFNAFFYTNIGNTSCGLDVFLTKLLKIIEPSKTKSFTLLTNKILSNGKFPDKYEIAKVIPIYKKVSQQYLIIIDPCLFYQLFQKDWTFLPIVILLNKRVL